jgi:hypothetical protein
MSPADAPVGARTIAPARPAARVVAARIAGRTIEAIADSEGLSRKRVEKLLRDELRRRSLASPADYARLQIARLESLAATLAPLAAAGETAVIDRLLKIFDRLDRCHGLGKAAPADDVPDEDSRALLLARLNRMAERMIAARESEP